MLDLKSQITMTSEVFSQETFPSLHRSYYASFWTWGHAKNSHGWENIGRESLVTACILKSDSAFQTKNLCVNREDNSFLILGNIFLSQSAARQPQNWHCCEFGAKV